MYFDNHLTDDDLQRAHDISPNPPPAMPMAGSFCSLLEASETGGSGLSHAVSV
jgi:hypothetical protein